MADIEKVINGMECCYKAKDIVDCRKCPYFPELIFCKAALIHDARELLKKQDAIIKKYQSADTFLEAHGWKWGKSDG